MLNALRSGAQDFVSFSLNDKLETNQSSEDTQVQ